MIREIYLYGSSVLRLKAAEVDLSDKEHIASLVQDLKDTLRVADGCGLAAPQIGVSERVVIVDGDIMREVYDYLKGFRRTLINPVIVDHSATTCSYEEGCLSVPGIYANVQRPETITVRYYDEDLREVTETFDRFAARMVQHELSHLEGELFTDIVAPIRKKIISKKLQEISAGKQKPRYKAKISR